ncbi:glycosyltransferase [Candidatus Peregrinibacteria bacterium]|nr:glycosyltransferase [Candidatus Peregrinibacteria bacterium]
MKERPKASIIILDYLKSRRVCENVESILEQITDFPYEVIVVDNSANPLNAKKLKTLRKHRNVKIIINDENLGYPKGNNRGVKKSKGDYILIVNPDIVWKDKKTLQKLITYMDKHPEVGVLGPQQVNEGDGSIAMTVRRFPKLTLQIARRTFLRRLPLLRSLVAKDECRDLNYYKTQPVDWLQSSFWITRRTLWNKLGGLNQDYLIFMSDPDYCFKCWQAGYQVIYHPDVTVHADGLRASAGGLKEFFKTWILRQHFKDALKYRWSHLFKGNPRKRFLKKIKG